MKKKNKNLIAYSNEHKLYLKKQKQKKWIILISQIMVLVIFLALWELLTQVKILDSFIMSSPSRIFNQTIRLFNSGELFYHIFIINAMCIMSIL